MPAVSHFFQKGCAFHAFGQISQGLPAHQAPHRSQRSLRQRPGIKRRTVANEACDNGLVTVNGKPARASYDVKVGDQITLRFGARTLSVEVLSVQETVRQADAAALYREVGR